MARTVKKIQDQMLVEMQAKGSDLNSISESAIYKLIIYIVASAIHLFELILSDHKKDVDQALKDNRFGLLPSYVVLVKDFQVDHDLVLIDGRPGYAEIDEEKRIIQKVAVIDRGNGLKLKVAKLMDGLLGPLSDNEQLQLDKYLEKTKIAGTEIELINLPSDEIIYTIDIYFDAIYKASEVYDNVNLSLEHFRDKDDFDSFFNRNDFLETIRSTTGVVDASISILQGKQGENIEAIQLRYDVKAGYYNYSATSVLNMINANQL